jgi:hypothetical protein
VKWPRKLRGRLTPFNRYHTVTRKGSAHGDTISTCSTRCGPAKRQAEERFQYQQRPHDHRRCFVDSGTIRGRRVMLQASAKVQGDIFHQGIGIEMGTRYDGTLRWTEDEHAFDKPLSA